MRTQDHAHKNVTIDDVATHASVSSQTVSRVINNHPSVKHETRKRVLQSIATLGYRPNRAAQNLASRRSKLIGVTYVHFDSVYYGPAQISATVERAALEYGYDTTFTGIEMLDVDHLHRAISELESRSVDGIILITPLANVKSWTASPVSARLPMVMIDIEAGTDAPSVAIDQFRGGQMAAQHLIDLGHKRFARLAGPLHWWEAKLRNEGWLDAIEKADCDPGPLLEGDWTAASGYQLTEQLLQQSHDVSAILVGNDQMALGVLRALHQHGLMIPQEISVVGFDDIPEAAYFQPPLTTVYQNFSALGRLSVEYLIKMIADSTTPRMRQVVQPALVIRESSGEYDR
jgi:DNA-binding LacI/PurR family transcriptional regulator